MIKLISELVGDNLSEVLLGVAGFIGIVFVYIFGRKDGRAVERVSGFQSAIAAYKRKEEENAKDVKKTDETKKLADDILHDPNSGFYQ
jgi:hypothetical protein